ncbi:hypothetical protein [Lentzea flaviverrucosa]|nr:hypothetical protein [Lentzea flaviverrucosa]
MGRSEADRATGGSSKQFDAPEGRRDLRAYLFRLEQGRHPHTGEPLPRL